MKILKSAFSILSIELTFILLFVAFWASNKGFEFSDESYSVLSITQSSESTDAFYYQHIIDFFFGWMNPGFVGLRLLRLFLTFFAAVFLASSISGVLIYRERITAFKNRMNLVVVSSICFVALMVSYSIYPQVLSYNNLTEIGLAVITALMLSYSLRLVEHKDKSARIFSFFLGVAVMFVFYSRFTSGILLIICIPLMMAAIRFKKFNFKKSVVYDLLYFTIGIACTFIFTSVFIYSNLDWLRRMSESISYMPGHSVPDILQTYWESVLYMYDGLIGVRLLFPLSLILLIRMKKKLELISFLTINLFQVLSLMFLIIISIYSWKNDLIFSGVKFISSAIFFHLIMLVCVFSMLLSKDVLSLIRLTFWKNTHLMVMAGFLFLLPLIGSAGTNNSLHIQFLQFAFAWIILSLAFLYKVRQQIGHILAGGLVLIMILGSFSQTIHGLIYSPYRIPGTLMDQKIVKELKNGDRLLVDAKTHAIISGFESRIDELPNFKKGDPMIVLMSIPGYIYLAEAGVVKNAWANSAFPETVCYSIKNSKRDDLSKTVILSPRNRGVDPIILECMHQRGINFPQAYIPRYSFTDPVYGMPMDLYTRNIN